MEPSTVFCRYEKKYALSGKQKERLLFLIGDNLLPDPYGNSTVSSIYLDTPDHRLIRQSLDGEVFKEKLRLRAYGVPKADDTVFLEIKRKFRGIVTKRRILLKNGEAERCLRERRFPADSQIEREIGTSMQFYGYPQPAAAIIYDREAYYWREDPRIRLTFDRNIRARKNELSLTFGTNGKKLPMPGECLLEVKTLGAMPLILSKILSSEEIGQISFSKYGTFYSCLLKGEENEFYV